MQQTVVHSHPLNQFDIVENELSSNMPRPRKVDARNSLTQAAKLVTIDTHLRRDSYIVKQ